MTSTLTRVTPQPEHRPTGAARGLGTGATWLGLLVAVAVAAPTANAFAARRVPVQGAWAQSYAEHPTVAEVRQTGYLILSTRAMTLSPGLPLDRALAVVSAMTVPQARKYKVAKGIARALRARHSIGPSGALLGKAIPATKLTPREALLLGWARAREARGDRKTMAARAPAISGAGPLQLLEQAATALPQEQAAQLALALARAAVAPTRGKRACEAYKAVQRAARTPGKASVHLSIAEAAAASVKRLGRACPKKVRRSFAAAISLPPPPTYVAPSSPTRRSGRAGRPARAGRTTHDDLSGQGIAFAVMAPVFKGYLNVPLVGRLARRERLNDLTLWQLMKKDPTGDATLAALNASVLMRRLAPDDTFDTAYQAVLRARGMLGASKARLAKLRVSELSGPQAMALAYARALQGRGLERAAVAGDAEVLKASPHQLFKHARQRVPANASLGPILYLAHQVDMQRQASPCSARKRAEATGFVIAKSSLPSAAKRALASAMTTVQGQCPTAKGHR